MTEFMVRPDTLIGHDQEWVTLETLRNRQLLELLQEVLSILQRREMEHGPWPSDMHLALAMAIIGVNKLDQSIRGQLQLAAEAQARAG